MSDDVIIHEAGMRASDGSYYSFTQSRDVKQVDDYIDIMKKTKPDDFTIVKLEKTYRCISTVPHIVK